MVIGELASKSRRAMREPVTTISASSEVVTRCGLVGCGRLRLRLGRGCRDGARHAAGGAGECERDSRGNERTAARSGMEFECRAQSRLRHGPDGRACWESPLCGRPVPMAEASITPIRSGGPRWPLIQLDRWIDQIGSMLRDAARRLQFESTVPSSS